MIDLNRDKYIAYTYIDLLIKYMDILFTKCIHPLNFPETYTIYTIYILECII